VKKAQLNQTKMPAQSHHLVKFCDLMEDLEELVEEAGEDRCRDWAEVSVLEDIIHTVCGGIVKELHKVTADLSLAQLEEANNSLASTKMRALKKVGEQRLCVRRAMAHEKIPGLMRAGTELKAKATRSSSLSPEDKRRLQASLKVLFEEVDKLAELTDPGDDLIALQWDLKGAAKSLAAAVNGDKKRRQSGGQGADSKEDGDTSYTSRDLSNFAKIIANAVSSGKKSRNKMHMPKWPTFGDTYRNFPKFHDEIKSYLDEFAMNAARKVKFF